jgi:tetratricopeptide (TPR) repeat protein
MNDLERLWSRWLIALMEADPEDWEAIGGEAAHLVRAGELVGEDPDLSIRFALAARLFCQRRGLGREYLEWARRAAGQAHRLGRVHDEIPLLLGSGQVHQDLDEWEDASSAYERALRLAGEIGDNGWQAYAWNNIGAMLGELGRLDDALHYYQLALDGLRRAGDRGALAALLHNLAHILGDRGKHRQAIETLERALEIERDEGNVQGMAATLLEIAVECDLTGDVDGALESYQQAGELHRRAGDRGGEADVLSSLALLHEHVGDGDRALECFLAALAIREELGDGDGQAEALTGIGALLAGRGETDAALAYHRRGLAIYEALGDASGQAAVLNNISLAHARANDGGAVAMLEGALLLACEGNDAEVLVGALHNLGLRHRAEGRRREAFSHLREALRVARNAGLSRAEGMAANSLGLVCADAGRLRCARGLYERAIALHQEFRNPAEEATTQFNLATLDLEDGDVRAAVQRLARVVTLGEQTGARDVDDDRRRLEEIRALAAERA